MWSLVIQFKIAGKYSEVNNTIICLAGNRASISLVLGILLNGNNQLTLYNYLELLV